MIVYGKNDDETVRLTMKATGLPEIEVRFILAITKGEIDGDVVDLDKHPRK